MEPISTKLISPHNIEGDTTCSSSETSLPATPNTSTGCPDLTIISDSRSPTLKGVASETNKRKRATASNGDNPVLIKLVKQKPTVKSPMFMNSTASIFAAVCKCRSMLQSISYDDIDSNSGDDILAIVDDHFGACPIFKQNFATTLAAFQKSSSSPPTASIIIIEQALHTSVRHLCSKECFLRAYLPVREYCMLWRDISIDGSIGRTKEQLLNEWRCRLVPPEESRLTRRAKASEKVVDIEQDKGAVKMCRREHARNSSAQITFMSPDGSEYRSKTSAVKSMNCNYCNSLKRTPSTPSMKVKGRARSKNIRLVSPMKCSGSQNVLVNQVANLNPLFSPLGLLEELFVNDPWRLLVSTICLNVTTRVQVDCVLHTFLEQWPTAEATANAEWEEIFAVISPLGLGTKRAKGLVRFSAEYIQLVETCDAFCLEEKQVTSLFFCGNYSWSAYNIFIRGEIPSGAIRVCDHALQAYVEYQLGRRRK